MNDPNVYTTETVPFDNTEAFLCVRCSKEEAGIESIMHRFDTVEARYDADEIKSHRPYFNTALTLQQQYRLFMFMEFESGLPWVFHNSMKIHETVIAELQVLSPLSGIKYRLLECALDSWAPRSVEIFAIETDKTTRPLFPEEVRQWRDFVRESVDPAFYQMVYDLEVFPNIMFEDAVFASEVQALAPRMEMDVPGSGISLMYGPLTDEIKAVGVTDKFLDEGRERAYGPWQGWVK